VIDQWNTRIIQAGYVADDLERATAWFERHLGANGFDHFGVTTLNDAVIDGQVADEWSIEVVGTMIGDLNVEIIRPLGGAVDMYREVLVAGAPATFHHFALEVDDWDEAESARESLGLDWKARGYTEGVCDFGYLDLRPSLGHYIEFLRLEPGTIAVIEDLKRKYSSAHA
jgi:catechol 2,3-dioxygenase-like lactoylglutathione lyase family enzyme